MVYVADVICACLVGRIILPDIASGSAYFRIREARGYLPFYPQQTQILAAATARTPLAAYGIVATHQGGFHANLDQEIHWQWEQEEFERCLERKELDISIRRIMEGGRRRGRRREITMTKSAKRLGVFRRITSEAPPQTHKHVG